MFRSLVTTHKWITLIELDRLEREMRLELTVFVPRRTVADKIVIFSVHLLAVVIAGSQHV